jgi:hypothetical protein
MEYTIPELVVLGQAATVVQGGPPGEDDNIMSDELQPPVGFVLGLDE